MRPLRTFTVEPSLPEELAPLRDIARNLWWAWHGEAQNLFRRLDPNSWERSNHNPTAMLGEVSQERLLTMARDEGFLSHLMRVYTDLEYYRNNQGWWSRTYGPGEPGYKPDVAYFSMEFGLTECLPIYSGGLGVLAGDHMKAASDLDVPLVGVGLLYQQGYFRQRLNADGWQLELFPRNDFHNMPVEQIQNEDGSPMVIHIELPTHIVHTFVWKVTIGRIALYLLDTNVPENSREDRHITAQLYGGDHEMRIRQEVLLGIGGVHLLRALDIEPKAYHMNEGHSAFLSLERIRHLMWTEKATYEQAREAVYATNIFTTHTPVPAGNDAFPMWMVEKYLAHYIKHLGMTPAQFQRLGQPQYPGKDEPFNMTIFAIRMSAYHNGVSELHGQIARSMWANVWPALPESEVPIDGLVNGIHTLSWISHDMAGLFDRYLGSGWHEKPADQNAWDAAQHIPDEELWRTHERRRERLVAFARRRQREVLVKRGAGAAEIATADEILDPEVLTIGFARRFATYKRANLILRDLERLEKIVTQTGRRVQIIFAGKAHPKDNPGKDLIREIVHTSRNKAFRRSLLFLEDYDMNVARYLVQGVDVWLNTPLRPLEASGTSGMKVAANGGLNVSIPDGWWAEGYAPPVGWCIGAGEEYEDLDYQNDVESRAMYDLLEKEIVPLFYSRGSDNLPRKWIAKMKAAIGTLAPMFNTSRMVRQYAERYYVPATAAWETLHGNDLANARELAAWKHTVSQAFPKVQIESVQDHAPDAPSRVGERLHVEAVVALDGLAVSDVAVELYFGPLDENGQLMDGESIAMTHSADETNSRYRFVGDMPCQKSGLMGYTVRVLPSKARHDPMLAPLAIWA